MFAKLTASQFGVVCPYIIHMHFTVRTCKKFLFERHFLKMRNINIGSQCSCFCSNGALFQQFIIDFIAMYLHICFEKNKINIKL